MGAFDGEYWCGGFEVGNIGMGEYWNEDVGVGVFDVGDIGMGMLEWKFLNLGILERESCSKDLWSGSI